jgi:predicted GIY-YIG superfamily endonuclease
VKTWVYRAKDESGSVLYVGMTSNPTQRQATHACNAPWRDLSGPSLEWVEFETRQDASAFEKAEIARLRPKFNKACNPDVVTLKSDDLVGISFLVPTDLLKAWKRLALDRGASLKKLITTTLREHISEIKLQ